MEIIVFVAISTCLPLKVSNTGATGFQKRYDSATVNTCRGRCSLHILHYSYSMYKCIHVLDRRKMMMRKKYLSLWQESPSPLQPHHSTKWQQHGMHNHNKLQWTWQITTCSSCTVWEHMIPLYICLLTYWLLVKNTFFLIFEDFHLEYKPNYM